MNIDDVFDKAKEAVNIAAKKTEEVVNISKLKYELVKVNNEIRSYYEKLGNSIYKMKKEGYQNDDLVNSLCEEIDELLFKASALNHEIADLQNVVICPVCSQKNVKDSFYCAKCGAKMKEEEYQDYSEPSEPEESGNGGSAEFSDSDFEK